MSSGEPMVLVQVAFAARLAEVPTGDWQGPVQSGYGAHLVFVIARTEGRIPPLAEVRDAVHREWANARRLRANDELYEALLQRYTVIVEQPKRADAATHSPLK